ncbi:hypothetical protein HD554DRAFT_2012743 [Boletus coccyginus]|nr:hypothetical protein HD554DRAFT_2012743 [Boletus coccyginus]
MSTPAPAPTAVQPVERQDIHKSCRTIETLTSVLTDYSEAASAFAAAQKKLSKALRDAAGLKTNAQFAANAFGASSIILEVLADVDSKFAKLADRESHSISSEVKKWLKKLAREEKAHDERMNDSNARIKQASQAYEKKSKKGARDAGEERARYINLLSAIGPEMSQEKYNHAIHVTQQNTLVTFNVAASLSRIADAEWTRSCECVRRISPTIGSLGEWRSLCEGAWTGSLPGGLPEVSSEMLTSITSAVSEWGQTGLSTPVRRSLPAPPSHNPGSVSTPAASLLDPPRSPFSTATQNQGSINSITTLSAFPFPPTHFPVPPHFPVPLAMNEGELQQQQIQPQSQPSRAGSPHPTQSQGTLTPPAPILSDSPKQMPAADLPESLALDPSRSSHSSQVSQVPSSSHQSPSLARTPEAPPRPEPLTLLPEEKGAIKSITSGGDLKKPRRPSLIARVPPPSDKPIRPASPFKRAVHYSAEKEFGVHTDSSKSVFKSHSVDAAKKNLERTESTHSTGGNVAALRNKYTRPVEASSQGLKDIPRLPMSVSEIASRYQPVDEPLSPRRTASPIVDQFPPDTPTRASARDLPIDENEIQRRKQRIEELAELELKEKEFELRQRERELNQRTRDFERDRLQFLHSRPEPGNASDGPKGPRNSPFQHKRGSKSVTHFNLPSGTSSSGSPLLMRPSTSHSTARPPLLPSKDHAPFCGCDSCSVSKYKATDASLSPRDLRPPEPPILLRPEKPKGWIRRLSMPSVNVAFSLDAKKNASAISLKAGLPLPSENGRLRKRSYEQGISNRTVTGIGR